MKIYAGPKVGSLNSTSVDMGVNETSTILMILILMVFVVKTKRFQALVSVIKS